MTFKESLARYALVVVGLAAGVVILIISIVFFLLGVDIWQLTACIAFGVILSVFGTTARVQSRGWVISGGGAVAVILFLVLVNFGVEPTAHVYIEGEFRPSTQIAAHDGPTPLLGTLEPKGQLDKRFHFIVEPHSLTGLDLTIDIFDSIENLRDTLNVDPSRHVQRQAAAGRVMVWEYTDSRLINADGEIISDTRSARIPASNTAGLLQFFIETAYAQTRSSPISELVNGLKSPVLGVQIESRTILLERGAQSVRPLLDALRAEYGNARLRHNVIYILWKLYHQNKHEVVAQLRPPDRELIRRATADQDEATRRYALSLVSALNQTP